MKKAEKRTFNILLVLVMLCSLLSFTSAYADAHYTLTGASMTASRMDEDSQTRWLFTDAAFSLNWIDGNTPASDSYEVWRSPLYKNEVLSEQLKARPGYGTDYYYEWSIHNLVADDHSIDFTKLTKADCTVTITGYDAECVSVTPGTDALHRDCVTILYKIRRQGSAPATPYTLTGVSVAAAGVVKPGSIGRWIIDLSDISDGSSLSWKSGNAPAHGSYYENDSVLCADAALSQPISDSPENATDYYFSWIITSITDNDHSLDFTKLTASDCTLTLPGYDTECVSVTPGTNSVRGTDKVTILYKIRRQESAPATPYTLTGTSLTGTGVEKMSGAWWVSASELSLSWKDGNAPASDSYMDLWSGLYKDAGLSQELSAEPGYDTDYYFDRDIINHIDNDHNMDFTELTAADCTITIAGYDAECVSVTLGTDAEGRDKVTILYKIRRQESAPATPYTLTGTSLTGTGVEKMSGAWWVSASELSLSWKDGNAPASDSYMDLWSGLYKDAGLSQELSAEPGYDTDYYFDRDIINHIDNDHNMDFTELTAADCTITIAGYDAECVSVTLGTDAEGRDKVTILYKIRQTDSYTITVTNGKAYSDSNFTTVITSAQAGDTVYFMEDSSALPANNFWYDITYTGISDSDVTYRVGPSYQSGSFIMPSGAVEIAYLYKASTPLTIDFTSAKSVAVGAAGWDGVMSAKQNGLISMDIDNNGSVDWDFGPMPDATILLADTCSVSGTYNYTLVDNPISPLTFIFPAPVTKYPVWVGATQVTSANKDDILSDGGKAKYNPETNTLTLNNPTVSGSHNNGMICYNPGPSDPDLLKITGSATINDGSTKVGILGIESSIELNGTFDLTGTEWGIGAFNVTVSGGAVTAHGGKSGISAQIDITISGGTVNATGDAKYGIESEEGSVTISGGTVNTTGRTNGIIATDGSIVISGGKVTAKALVPYESAAISAGKDITISGGTVTAQDGNNGIRALNGTISIENGTEKVLADGITYSIRADSISIGDDMMIKEPEGGTVEKDEFDANVIMDGSSVANHALIVPKTAATCTVTFDANGHGTAPAAQTVEAGKAAAKPSDPTETGWIFGGWYTEAACTNAFNFSTPITGNITLYAKWTEENITPVEITYTVTSGGNSTWIKDSNSNVIITVKRSEADETCFSHFSGVRIDGTTLAAGDYEARSGSTVITLKAATLQKLSVGDHTVTISFDDGKAETKLTVKAASSTPTATPKPADVPKTGDSADFQLWLGLILLGLIGISVLGLTAIRYRK